MIHSSLNFEGFGKRWVRLALGFMGPTAWPQHPKPPTAIGGWWWRCTSWSQAARAKGRCAVAVLEPIARAEEAEGGFVRAQY